MAKLPINSPYAPKQGGRTREYTVEGWERERRQAEAVKKLLGPQRRRQQQREAS